MIPTNSDLTMYAAMHWLEIYSVIVSLILLTVTIQSHNNDTPDILLDNDCSILEHINHYTLLCTCDIIKAFSKYYYA